MSLLLVISTLGEDGLNDDLELAYLAGFFDGEGSIGLYDLRGNDPRYAEHRRCLVAKVGQLDRKPLELFKNRFGGSIQQYATPKGDKPYYRWSVSHRKARVFAEIIIPYLFLKKDLTKRLLDESKRILRPVGGPKGKKHRF